MLFNNKMFHQRLNTNKDYSEGYWTRNARLINPFIENQTKLSRNRIMQSENNKYLGILSFWIFIPTFILVFEMEFPKFMLSWKIERCVAMCCYVMMKNNVTRDYF